MTLPRYPDCSVILFVCSPLKYLKMADSDIAALRSYVIRILPRLTPGEIDKVMERLDELGVDEIGSFKFVQVQQLESVLKPVYIAKLIASAVDATDADSTTLDQTSTPSSQHSRHIPLSPIDVQQHQVEQTTPRRAAPSDPNWAMSFSVLWDEVPKKILNLLHEGKRLQKTERCNLVRCVVASVRQICDRPIRKELEYIAQKMMMAYPGSLREELGGDVVGTGYDSLLSQLTARVENEHRLSTRNSLSQLREKHSAENENEATSASFARSKIMKRDLYGCVRWQQSLPVGETDESQQQQQQLLLELHETTPWNVAAVEQSMKKTYPTQRSDINNGLMGGIVSLKGKWPFIFVPVGMFVHVEELLDFNMADVMKNSLMSKGPRIIGYLSSQTNQFIKTTLAEMNQAKGVLKSSEPEVPAMLLCIMSILSEETNVLLTLLDEAASPSDAESISRITPFIVGCGNSLLTCPRFMLVIDGKVVNQNITGIVTALTMLLASFYVFNIEYPREAASTLEFIQRCLCRLNPSGGSKTKKAPGRKHTTVNAHVLRLIKAIADFEWL